MPNIKGFALEKLEALRERLLDLTARNRMINSKFSAYGKKHFRIIDEIPQQVYEKLSSSSMTFQPLPPLEDEPKDEKKKIFIMHMTQIVIMTIKLKHPFCNGRLKCDGENAVYRTYLDQVIGRHYHYTTKRTMNF